MKISGFTMCKNAQKLYYPIRAVISSILPIVDEFVVALGDCDPDDKTREEIEKINSDKIKIIDTVWNLEKYPDGMENAHQTDIAKNACVGDWCFYLQADEVVHEKYHKPIVDACRRYHKNPLVEGLLFKYLHFWGDYEHFNNYHGWYPQEIRIVRNDPDIHSFQSAQSFRRIPNFDGVSYRQKDGTHKLKVKPIDACIYHYGWVRPPRLMQNKTKALDTIHKGRKRVDEMYANRNLDFDYGDMTLLPEFKGTHPKVMAEFMADFHWRDQLHYQKGYKPDRPPVKHEQFRNRFLTFIEQKFLGGRQLMGYSNWELL